MSRADDIIIPTYEVILNYGGCTHRHKKKVAVGDLWINIYNHKHLVVIKDTYQHSVEVLDTSLSNDIKEYDLPSFYSLFRILED